ncbi:hypothetical protein A6R68_24272, partial [Neotoma lepida]
MVQTDSGGRTSMGEDISLPELCDDFALFCLLNNTHKTTQDMKGLNIQKDTKYMKEDFVKKKDVHSCGGTMV